jgi:outer membrane protein assembly factor BamB
MLFRAAIFLFIAVAGVRLAAEPVPDLGTRKAGEDWPGFLGPRGDGKSAETGIIAPWPAAGPRVVWHKRLGTGYGMPAISRGRLFQFSRYGKQARLECLNAETGEALWDFEYPSGFEDMFGYDNGPRAQPVVDDDLVFTFGAEGMLHCLRVVDGALVWKVDTSAKFGVIQNFFGVGSTPVVEGKLLIVNVGGSPAEDQNVAPGALDRVSGNGSGVVAFDKRSGEVVYQLSDELASYASPRLATIGGRRWCFMFARGGLIGFDPTNGKQDFHFPWRAPILESVNASSPVVVDDMVFISETYGPGSALLKVRPGGYDLVWRDESRTRDKRMLLHWNTPIYHDGCLFGSSGRHPESALLRCLEMKPGTVKWDEPGLARASLLYVDGHLVCLNEQGELLLLKASSAKFDVVSRVLLEGVRDADVGGDTRLLKYPAWAAPILSHGLMYVRGKDRLVCLELIPEGAR